MDDPIATARNNMLRTLGAANADRLWVYLKHAPGLIQPIAEQVMADANPDDLIRSATLGSYLQDALRRCSLAVQDGEYLPDLPQAEREILGQVAVHARALAAMGLEGYDLVEGRWVNANLSLMRQGLESADDVTKYGIFWTMVAIARGVEKGETPTVAEMAVAALMTEMYQLSDM